FCFPLPLLLASALLFSVVAAFWAVGLGTLPLTLPLYLWLGPGRRVSIDGGAPRGRLARAGAAASRALLLASAPRVTPRLAPADVGLAGWLLSPPRNLAARITELEVSRERVVDAAGGGNVGAGAEVDDLTVAMG